MFCTTSLRQLLSPLPKVSIRSFLIAPVALYTIPKRNKLPPRPKWLIVEDELDEVFLKGGRGPGGQKINKSNSKVQLTHKPTGLVVTCQYSRSQEQNRKRAREILALKIEEKLYPDTCRTAVVNERKTKTKQSKLKKANRKYKKLDEERKIKQQEDKEELSDLLDIESDLDNLINISSVSKDNTLK